MLSKRRFVRLAALLGAGTALAALCWAQAGGGQQGGQGNAPLRGLVGRGIDLILANPADNSIIVHDPPVDDPNAPPKVVVRPQWLEVTRTGPQLLVRRFRSVDSPEVTVTSGQMAEARVRTPSVTATYPIRVVVGKASVVSLTMYAADKPGEVLYRLKPEEGVHLGESVVAKGLIFPQPDGTQRETYLQLTFSAPAREPEKPAGT